MLQAAVRGHLVRCRAAGSLRCIQAIVKMQTLVRAHRTNLSVGRSSIGKKVSKKYMKLMKARNSFKPY